MVHKHLSTINIKKKEFLGKAFLKYVIPLA